MELDDFPSRFKAAKMLTRPHPGEQGKNGGISTEAVAARINQGGLSYGTLRNMENAIRQPEERDVYAIAKALELPMEFFTLTRAELLGVIAGAGAPPLPGETGRRIRDDRPSAGDPPLSATRGSGDS